MSRPETVADRILKFNEELAGTALHVPPDYRVINPFRGPQKERVLEVTTAFYRKYYNDDRPRRLVLGSSPARRGTAVTGVPFEDARFLESDTGVDVGGYAVSRPSAGFLDNVINRCGGRAKFYADFVMSFVCPLGLARTNLQGREVNANFYDNKELLGLLHDFLVDALERQIAFGVDTSVCYCIGISGNFDFLSEVNKERRFFKEIVALEHPRFITQYNGARTEEFMEKYLSAFRGEGN
ncbi:uracil-DNA glycosylase family protein [Streptomyces sp. NPDC007172]|uniref:uracil-DNA glycosylase family protein n=1 Tax=Streptomyces sp. NPDC007172 TaxID=3364776 RepID=UPI003693AE93